MKEHGDSLHSPNIYQIFKKKISLVQSSFISPAKLDCFNNTSKILNLTFSNLKSLLPRDNSHALLANPSFLAAQHLLLY